MTNLKEILICIALSLAMVGAMLFGIYKTGKQQAKEGCAYWENYAMKEIPAKCYYYYQIK